ncbi:MAG: FtsW/RodA/SpoVE family cell cycle protein [Bacilli bacterium]
MKRLLKWTDWYLVLPVLILSIVGVLMIYSTTMVSELINDPSSSGWGMASRQAIFVGIGIVAMTIVAFGLGIRPLRIPKQRSFLFFIGMLFLAFLLVIVLFTEPIKGARSWIDIGFFSLQPTEFVKIGMILYVSSIFAIRQNHINHVTKSFLSPSIVVGALFALIAIQPDLGGVGILTLIYLCLIFASGVRLFKILVILVGSALAGGLGVLLGSLVGIFRAEQLARILSWQDLFADAKGESYQVLASLQAFVNGGMTGAGLGMSVQKYGYLPEAQTDFIMAIVAEELGFITFAGMLLLVLFVILRAFHLARACRDPFYSLVAVGIGSYFAIQAGINIGGITGALPLTGVTFPFVSYGGSSLVTSFVAVGILLYVSFHVQKEQEKRMENANNREDVAEEFH